MSTKVTWLYGDPNRDGEENDYHLYFDFKDFSVHLEINGKEIWLPPKLRKELEEIWEIYEMLRDLISRVYVHAEKNGYVDAWRLHLGIRRKNNRKIITEKEKKKIVREIERIMKKFEEENTINFDEIGITVVLLPDYRGNGYQIIVIDEHKNEVKSVRSAAEAMNILLKKGATLEEIKELANEIDRFAKRLIRKYVEQEKDN